MEPHPSVQFVIVSNRSNAYSMYDKTIHREQAVSAAQGAKWFRHQGQYRSFGTILMDDGVVWRIAAKEWFGSHRDYDILELSNPGTTHRGEITHSDLEMIGLLMLIMRMVIEEVCNMQSG